MGERNRRADTRKGSPERAGRVTLHNEELGPAAQHRDHGRRNLAGMSVRIGLAGAPQLRARVGAQPERRDIQARMLAGDDQMGLDPSCGEGMGDGGKLDRFGPGADDQLHSFSVQPSPYLGGGKVPPLWRKSSDLAEVVGVGLDLEADGGRGEHVIGKSVLVAIGDGRIL